MITVLGIAALVVVAALLRGGSLESLAATQVRWLWLVWAALIVQLGLLLIEPSWLTDEGALWVLLATNLAIVIFMLLNRKLPGMALAAAGLLLNVMVISANGAMPVSERVLDSGEVSESDLDSAGLKHERMTEETTLPWLGDVIVIPVVREVWSAGDVVLAAGIGYFVWRRTRAGDVVPR
jgi:Family of unknown function (DUF5317)